MKLNAGCNLVWPTPIYKTTVSLETCFDLVTEAMLSENVSDPAGDSSSNLIDTSPTLKRAATEIYSEFFNQVYDLRLEEMEYDLKAWLTGSKGGYAMETHNHSGSQFIAIIYAMAEEQSSGGEIVLQDPRFNANRGFMPPFTRDFESVVHKPKTGDALIMPGFVYHYVRQYTSSHRLAMPIDIFIRE